MSNDKINTLPNADSSPELSEATSSAFARAAKYFAHPFRYEPEGQMICDNEGNRVLDVRGWGHLHGRGGCALPFPMAEDIQDEFGREGANLLNANWPNVADEPRRGEQPTT